jgi:hypothetical protein
MNVELLQQVKQHILENPARLRMDRWVVNRKRCEGSCSMEATDSSFVFNESDWGEPIEQSIPACGTVACIAGWTTIVGDNLDPQKAVGFEAPYRAKELLEIDHEQADRLFYVSNWPEELADAYIEWLEVQPDSKLPSKQVADANIGWCFGEGMSNEKMDMWKKCSTASHPIFGTTKPTIAEALEAGMKAGENALPR